MTSPGVPSVGSSGFHASRSARDSLRHVHGSRWFVAEARGDFDFGADDEFSAGEMRLVREIPVGVLRRFALLCATDCLPSLPDPSIRAWAEASLRDAADRLDSGESAPGIAIPGVPAGAAASRSVAAVQAASGAVQPASKDATARPVAGVALRASTASRAAAWAGAAASAAHAAHIGAAAARAVEDLAMATAAITNVASGAVASRLADRAAVLSRAAAAAGAAAHAASVEAANWAIQAAS
jgi:hypothetical protein